MRNKITIEYFRMYQQYYILPYVFYNNISKKSGLYELGLGWFNWGISIYYQK